MFHDTDFAIVNTEKDQGGLGKQFRMQTWTRRSETPSGGD